MKIRTYSELIESSTFIERFEYLSIGGIVGEDTFGFDRWINQRFYKSREWQDARRIVMLRDNGCDLGIPDHEIPHYLLIHHVNPLTPKDITQGLDWICDPEYLITTSRQTHNAIHYGDANLLPKTVIERTPGDTRLW